MKSNVDYHDIKKNDTVELVELVKDVHPNIFKVTLPGQKAIHYLYAFEVGEVVIEDVQ